MDRRSILWLGICALTLWQTAPLTAGIITGGDIRATDGHEIAAGNGILDLILLTDSAGGSSNSGGGFNGDDAFTGLPPGETAGDAIGSYVTSIGELRDSYRLTFPDGEGGSLVEHMVLVVDLNQINGGDDVLLQTLEIVVGYAQIYGDDRDNPDSSDVTSSLQGLTGDNYSGGTKIAWLPDPVSLPLNVAGAGWADYVINTGIDPFNPDWDDSTRILFHWASTGHDGGGETIFLSGIIPEPATLALLAIGGVLVVTRRRRR